MCGLVGLAGDTINRKGVFTELLLVDVVRGSHSTGAAIVTRDKDEIHLAKMPLPSQYFVASDMYNEMMKRTQLKVMLGHNRYATIGDKTADNAHPFQFENTVGAHNGTLDKWCIRDIDDGKNFGTDSEAIFYSIDKYGVQNTVANLRGAWALSWYDKKTDSINLLRNDKRPLYYAYDDLRGTVFWASEPDMLEWVLTRNGVKMFEDSYYVCEPNRHYKWYLPKNIKDSLNKPIVTECKEKPRAYYQHNFKRDKLSELEDEWGLGGDYSGFHYVGGAKDPPPAIKGGGTVNQELPFTPNPPAAAKAKAKEKVIDTKKFRPPYKDYAGRIINKAKFLKLTECGCLFCDEKDQVWGDFIHSLKPDVDGRQIYLCEDCYNDSDIRELISNTL